MRVINADVLLKDLNELYEHYRWMHDPEGMDVIDQAATIVKHQPAVTGTLQSTGRWLRTEAYPHRVYCSCCYKTYIINDEWLAWQNPPSSGGVPRSYCPSCGALMQGDWDDNHKEKI